MMANQKLQRHKRSIMNANASNKLTRSEQKKQDILAAAKQMFKADGVQATSMDKLAEAANVSKRTVYNHFATKEALVMYLVAELWQKAMQSDNFIYQTDMPLAPQLKALVLSEIELMCSPDYIDLSRVAFGHFFFKPEALQQEMAKFAKNETAMFKWLSAAAADNKLALTDIEFANHQIHHLIKGECMWPQLIGMADVLSKQAQQVLADETVAMFLARYG